MEVKYEQAVTIRIHAMRATMKDNMEAVYKAAANLHLPVDAILCTMILSAEGFVNIADEVRYAVQCNVNGKMIYSALRQCVSENTIQPLQMLYTEKGGGTE